VEVVLWRVFSRFGPILLGFGCLLSVLSDFGGCLERSGGVPLLLGRAKRGISN